ncbi:MAG: class I SAM-dependent methyltransferase [Phycisphaeraceae bacterium]
MFNANVNAVMDTVDALRGKVDDAWQIPRPEAQLLAQLVRLGQCRSICEIGVSYGFSTLHLAAAVNENDGHLHGFDAAEKKVTAATKHLAEAGLGRCATLHLGDARETVPRVTPDRPYDFVFIDAVKTQSRDYLDAVWPKLADRAVLVTDNTSTHPEELGDFVAHLRSLPNATSCGVDVGNGFELTILRRG